MGGIALKFGVSPEDLQAANPGISPNSMSIGQVLKIPSDPANPSGEPTPTPAPFTIEQVQCYAGAQGSMWCLVLAHNDTPDFYENVSVQVTLLDGSGHVIDSQAALPPLNILPPNASLPLSVFIPAGVPLDARPQVQVLTAIRLLAGDTRYLPASTQNVLVSVDWAGHSAQVSGQVQLPSGSKAAASVWVAATAYDEQGRVVGFRRWEGGSLQPGASLPFKTEVSSLGGTISRVELAVEARP
jgi:LysM repeat protein